MKLPEKKRNKRSGQGMVEYLVMLAIFVLAVIAFAQGGFLGGINAILGSADSKVNDASTTVDNMDLLDVNSW